MVAWNTVVAKIFPIGWAPGGTTDHLFWWKENGQDFNLCKFMGGKQPGRKKTGRSGTRRSVVIVHGWTNGIKHKMWRSLYCIWTNIHQISSTLDQALNNQVITQHISQCASYLSVITYPRAWTLGTMNRVIMVSGMEAMHVPNHMSSHLLRLVQFVLNDQQPARETNPNPQIQHYPSKRPTSHLVAGWTHWTPSILEEAAIHFEWTVFETIPIVGRNLSFLPEEVRQHHYPWDYRKFNPPSQNPI